MERTVRNSDLGDIEEELQIRSEIEDLRDIADFFAIETDSEQMRKLTGLDPEAISGIFNGSITESDRRDHSAVLGRFVRTSQNALNELSRDPLNKEGIRHWLEDGNVRTSQGFKKPIDALSDSDLALEALREVEAALAN